MKKKFSYILSLSLSLLSLLSCNKHYLDIAPQNTITGDAVFSSQSAVTAYIATLYVDLPMEDFNFSSSGFNTWWSSLGRFLWNDCDESITCLNDNQYGIGDGTFYPDWNYAAVRNVNNFIANLQANRTFDTAQVALWMGEAHFIRAYYYFGMVKRYGGVPIITTVQDATGNNIPALQVPRNTEKQVYDFIAADLDSAALLLGPTSDAGRANKYVAYALKSRVMLYAASIAEYGTVQLNGIVGIPSTSANGYWQAAYDAAAKVMDGTYSLYNKLPDPTQNFTNLFLDPSNPEAILTRSYSYPQKTHSFDLWALPHSVRGPAGYGSRINPTLELVEQYEYTDGSSGALKLTDSTGNPIEYANPLDLFANKDPRCAATIIFPFATWKTNTDPAAVIDVQQGIIDGSQTILSAPNNLYKGFPVIGQNGLGGGGGEVSQTGFYIRKFLNPAYARATVIPWSSSTQWIDIRYAEVLLNYAEAAFELGKTADAQNAINLIRTRAGIATLGLADVTRDRIRHERQVELAFENQRYWDIRRWRIADQILDNVKASALLPFYMYADGKYTFQRAPAGFPKLFTPKLYYERIDPAQITLNPKLIQNPGY